MADGLIGGFKGLSVTNNRIDGLMADFSGLNNLEKIVSDVLNKIALRDDVSTRAGAVAGGSMAKHDFDVWFSELVRVELGKVLGIVRARAIDKARSAGAGSAQTAISRRMYKNDFAGNINIAGNRKRISSKRRVVPPPDGGKSGIHRDRTVKRRTKQLREYYGPDRDFILRILESGRDVFMAKPEGPTGRRSKATYGRRVALASHTWFHSMQGDMEMAAQQLGETLTGAVEEWIETKFEEIK